MNHRKVVLIFSLLFHYNYFFAINICYFNVDTFYIEKWKRLEIIKCDNDEFNKIDFERYNALEQLVIDRCKIMRLPTQLYELSNLKILIIKDSPIKFIPRGISKLKNLQIINISGTRIDSLPEDISYIDNLSVLDVNDKILKLPKNFSRLKQLGSITFNLDYEKGDLNTELSKLSRLCCLKSLYFYCQTFNEESIKIISSIKTLKELGIGADGFNPEIRIWESISKIDSLNSLTITGKNIQIDSSIEYLVQIKKIGLHLQLKNFPVGIIKLSQLETIDLQNNRLRNIPIGISNLKNLKTLNLKNNPISTKNRNKINKIIPVGCKVIYLSPVIYNGE